jgi:DNA polymerase-1
MNPLIRPLILVDGSSYFYRAYHALPPLTNTKGQPTGAIYGVAHMIKRLINDHQPQQMAVVFDAKGKTFRDDWYPAYKANRARMPEELSVQFEPLVTLLKAMGLPLLIVEGVEADDVIGTLSTLASQQGTNVMISTGDKDMAQLVNDHVTLINTMTNQRLDRNGVKEKFGVTPAQMIDYLTLVGDTSDNIPGVSKCGPKTAIKWLDHYQSLERLIADADAIEGKIGENLRAFLPQLPLSKKLVSIKTDVELPLTLADLSIQPAHQAQMITLTRELEFKNWLKELLTQEEQPLTELKPTENHEPHTEKHATHYEIINEPIPFEHWIKKLHACSVFCVDTETTDRDAMCAEIVGISFAIDPNDPVYIPLTHQDHSQQLLRDTVLAELKPILENPMIQKIGHNLKYDFNVFKNHGILLRGITYDTMLESYLLNSAVRRHDMDSLALKYLGHQTISFSDVAGSGAKQRRFDEVPVSIAAPYAAEDAEITYKLHQVLYPMMDDTLQRVLHDIEVPLLTVLADMERHGVLIDKDILSKHGARLKERIHTLETEALQLAGKAFNLNSPKQLQDILYQDQQLPVLAKTPKGQPSTAESVLQELAFDYRLPAVILEYRSLSKLVSTYIDALPKRIHPRTQRVHTSYNQAVAATGRLSSSEPNLQNIPIRTEEGRLIRKAFIAPPQHVLLAADYSQIELRIMAHLSQDPNLQKAFAQGWDIHTATASELFSIDQIDVTSEHRRRAKAVNFGLIYGMSAFGLAKQLGIDRKDAQQYIDRYFQRYPGVQEYMEKTRLMAHQQGYVETLFGRRLYLPEINARNQMRQKAAERTAINAPMQGTAADIIKLSMLALSEWQSKHTHTGFQMIMQVHDELVFEVHNDAIESTTQTIRHLMEHAVELSVPLLVSIGVGHDWDEAH